MNGERMHPGDKAYSEPTEITPHVCQQGCFLFLGIYYLPITPCLYVERECRQKHRQLIWVNEDRSTPS